MEKVTFKNKDGTETEPILIYNTKINKYYFTLESKPFIEDISDIISSSKYFLADCLVITSSSEIYPQNKIASEKAHKNTIFSEKEIRKLFTEHIGQNINEILKDYIGKDTDEDKANLERIQDYINPSIETTKKEEEEGYSIKTIHKLERDNFPEELRDKIPPIYKDKLLRRIISNIPPEHSISIIYTEKDNEQTLYAEDHDKHTGYVSKIIATGKNALKIFDEIKEAKKISCIITSGQ